jgi:peptide/nickel transport system ATP-binding protein
MSDMLLHVRLNAGYGKQCTLEEIHFELQSGERLGLVGTSGAGKSTLVMALMGLLPWRSGWTRGKVLFEGNDLLSMKERQARRVRGKYIALVPQSPSSALNSALSLRAHFEEAWWAHEPDAPAELRARLKVLLQQVQLPTDERFLLRKPGEVSVGQAQRAVIALALLHRPRLLIADEPTSALDPVTQLEVLNLLRQTNREEGTALLYISHDLVSVLQLCKRLAVLDHGRIAECLSVEGIEAQARHPATLALLGTLPASSSVLRDYAESRLNANAGPVSATREDCEPLVDARAASDRWIPHSELLIPN